MQPSMWVRALKVIPRVDKAQWDQLDLVSRWLIATRAAVLVMTLVSSTIGALLALRDGAFDGLLFALVTAGLLFAHATNNLINDLTDHLKGVDRGNYFRTRYGPQPLEHGLLTRKQMMRYIVVTGGLAIAAGLALVVLRGGATLTLMAIGAFFVLFYTWPLKFIGLGEVAVLLVWGPLMVGGTYYVITGTIDTTVLAASLPFSLGATAVIFGKHIDKLEQDAAKGIRTLPVLLGEKASRQCVLAMMFAQYVVVVMLWLDGTFRWPVLAIAAAGTALAKVVPAYLSPRPVEPPKDYPEGIWPLWFVALAFHHTRRFGIAYVVGLVGEVLLSSSSMPS